MKKRLGILILLIIILSLFSIHQTTENENIQEEKAYTYNNYSMSITEYQEYYHNKDIIARLIIPNYLNILLVKGQDNDYYLDHNLYKESSYIGTEFIDYRNTLESKQINIYGHNSKTYNTNFHIIEKYLDEYFFNKNKFIILKNDNTEITYEIMLIKEVTDDYEHMIISTSGNSFIEHINLLKNNATYIREIPYNEESRLLVLQTCSYSQKGSYYIIVAIET